MKKLNFLFVAILFTCFAGITQANAQALVDHNYTGWVEIEYVAEDGTYVNMWIEGEARRVITPNGKYIAEFRGVIPEGVPLPKKAVKYVWVFLTIEFDILITPSGEVIGKVKFMT